MDALRHSRTLGSILLRYGSAIVAVGAAVGLKFLLVPLVTQDTPFLLFFVAVTLSAWTGGLGPGIFATLLAAFVNHYYFVPPFGRFDLSSADQQFRLLLFVIEGILVSLICARLIRARQRAEHNAAEARELERRILELSESEQRRIGHDLHDGLGQHLTGIALNARVIEQHLETAQSPDAEAAAKLSSLARTAVEWTHDLCRSLSPPALETDGLAEALRELCANSEVIFGIRCSFEADGAAAAFRDVATGVHLYRIAQEAISNAVKHGRASLVRLSLSWQPHNQLVLEIADNGRGFAPGKSASQTGMGLRIMNYRAKMIGAALGVDQPPGQGTIVTCRYALPPDAPHLDAPRHG